MKFCVSCRNEIETKPTPTITAYHPNGYTCWRLCLRCQERIVKVLQREIVHGTPDEALVGQLESVLFGYAGEVDK